MTHEEIVQKAFGEHWPTFEKRADQDGWVSDKDFWYMDAEDLFDIESESEYQMGYEVGVIKWRPRLIDDLITNNGWKKITIQNDHPEKYFKGNVVKDGKIYYYCEHRGFNIWWSYRWRILIENPTHYRKSEELKLPLH